MHVSTSSATRATSEPAGWAAFGGCALIWGSTFLFIGFANDTMPPLWGAALRLALAAVLLTLLAFATGGGLPRGAAMRAAAGFGFLNFGVNFGLLYWGQTVVPSGISAVVYGTIPLSTALFARAFGLEPLRPLKVAGAAAGLAGVAMIFSSQLRASVPPGPLVAVLVAATVASLSGVVLKRGPRQPALGANAVGAMAGLPVCLAGSFLLGEAHDLPARTDEWFPILYLAVAGSVGAYVLYAWLVNHWKLTRISFIAVLVPLVALILGALVRGERIGVAALAGAALVVAGVVLAIASDRAAR